MQLWWYSSEHSCLPNKAFVKEKERKGEKKKKEGREGVKERGRKKERERELNPGNLTGYVMS